MQRNRFDAVRYYFDYDNGTRRDFVVAVVDGKELDRLVLESGADAVATGVPYALVAPPSRHWLAGRTRS